MRAKSPFLMLCRGMIENTSIKTHRITVFVRSLWRIIEILHHTQNRLFQIKCDSENLLMHKNEVTSMLAWKLHGYITSVEYHISKVLISATKAISLFSLGAPSEIATAEVQFEIRQLRSAQLELHWFWIETQRTYTDMLGKTAGTVYFPYNTGTGNLEPDNTMDNNNTNLELSRNTDLAALRKIVPRLLWLIGRAFNIGEKGLGRLFGVTQPTISRWQSGELPPSRGHLNDIIYHFRKACSRVRDDFPIPTDIHYLCSFAPIYETTLQDEACHALKSVAINGLIGKTAPTE